MVSFRLDESEAELLERWSASVGLDRSAFLRDALRRRFDQLAAEHDGEIWQRQPLDTAESELGEIADWGPAEDWSDWGNHAAG